MSGAGADDIPAAVVVDVQEAVATPSGGGPGPRVILHGAMVRRASDQARRERLQPSALSSRSQGVLVSDTAA